LNSADLTGRAAALIGPQLAAHSSILVGLSGGMDSVVLLHLLHRLAARHSWQLAALHVHHGISPNADDWVEFCRELCAGQNIPLHIEHVDIAPLRDHGIENAARKLRHAAFARQSCDFVALAHHADDQVETLMLQMLRGAGVRGASAMPLLGGSAGLGTRAGSHAVLRPLLHSTRREILDYATTHQLRWIEDESNQDDSYPRNFLRHRLLPVLEQKFPSYRATLARSAQHFAEAGSLLDELAQLDGLHAIQANTLDVSALQALTPPRARNLLRFFLHGLHAPMPQAVQLDDMLQQLCTARQDASVCIAYGDWQVRRYQGKAYVMRALAQFDREQVSPWHGENQLDWPALQARVGFQRIQGEGISLAKLREAPVTLRLRRGGEALRPSVHAATRTLTNLLQEQHIPPWRRERLPLLYCGTELVCIPGVAVAAEYQAEAMEAAVHLHIDA
jgi:tRNA(Ile)-lysidine synthase